MGSRGLNWFISLGTLGLVDDSRSSLLHGENGTMRQVTLLVTPLVWPSSTSDGIMPLLLSFHQLDMWSMAFSRIAGAKAVCLVVIRADLALTADRKTKRV